MAGTDKDPRPQTKVSGTYRRKGKGPHDDVEARLGYALVHVPALCSFLANLHFRELRVTEVEDGWRVMVKGDRRGKPLVTYFYHDTYKDAMVLALTSLDIAQAAWHPDGYPPKRYPQPTIPLRF